MSGPKDALPVRTLLQQIQAKIVSPKSLDVETRRDVVELLHTQGFDKSAIAQILECTDRTVRRHQQAIRERNALEPDPSFIPQFVGELVAAAARHGDALVRLARDATASVAERSQAEFLAWKVHSELTQRLQSLGYLPTAPTTLVADISVTEHGGIPSFAALGKELQRIDAWAVESGADTPDASRTRQHLLAKVDRGRLAEQIDQIQPRECEDGADDETPTATS